MGEDKRNMVQQLFKAQIAVSEVLGRLHFNTAAFCGWYEVRATEAAIFKRDGSRPI